MKTTSTVTVPLSAALLVSSVMATPVTSNIFDFELDAGIENDSNLNIVETDTVSQKNDWAKTLHAGVDGHFQPIEPLNLKGSYSYMTKSYEDSPDFDLDLHQLSADASYNFNVVTLGGSYHHAHALLAGEPFMDLDLSTVYLNKMLTDMILLRVANNAYRKRFDVDIARDASIREWELNLFVFFNNANTFWSVSAANSDENARDDLYDNHASNIKAGFSHKFTAFNQDNKVLLSWHYLVRDYEQVDPELAAKRADTRQNWGLEWELALNKNLSLVSKVDVGRYHSNLAIAEYSETVSAVLLRARF